MLIGAPNVRAMEFCKAFGVQTLPEKSNIPGYYWCLLFFLDLSISPQDFLSFHRLCLEQAGRRRHGAALLRARKAARRRAAPGRLGGAGAGAGGGQEDPELKTRGNLHENSGVGGMLIMIASSFLHVHDGVMIVIIDSSPTPFP